MARTYSRSVGRSRRQERARGALREKGWAACVLGVALLTVFPLVAGTLMATQIPPPMATSNSPT